MVKSNIKLIYKNGFRVDLPVMSDLSGIALNDTRPVKAIISNLEINNLVDASKKCEWILNDLINCLGNNNG